MFKEPLPEPDESEQENASPGSTQDGLQSEDFADLVDYPRGSSTYCGDGAYDPDVEECDDGVSEAPDGCSNDCQTRDILAVAPVESGRLLARRLGTSPHVSSGADWGGALTWVDTSAEPQVVVQTRDVYGNRLDERVIAGPGSVDSPRQPIALANPAVATLPSGLHVVAFNDLNGDGSELGVSLSVLRASEAGHEFEVVDAGFANTTSQGAQSDADLVWTGRALVAAWVDTSDPERGPDVVFREFGANLSPSGAERPLDDSRWPEGAVALCAARSSAQAQDWAAVWRRGLADGAEAIVVRLGDEVLSFRPTLHAGTPGTVDEATVPEPGDGLMPGHLEDRPAIVSLAPDVVLVAFTVGTDPGDSGVANVFRVWGAVIDFGSNEVAWIGPIGPVRAGAPDLTHAQRQPALTDGSFPNRPGTAGSAYLAWRAEGKLGDAEGEEIWLKRLDWDAAERSLNTAIEEVALPRDAAHQLGDQRRPALATIEVPGGYALSMSWEDWGRSFDDEEIEQAHPDLVVQVAPLPLRRDLDKIKDCARVPCGVGEGPCGKAEDCQGGLVCAPERGPWHGYGPTTAVCEPAHCTNGLLDGGEADEDCGGECGSCFSCAGSTSSLGTAHYCSAVCRCDNLEGDCDTSLDCNDGLSCFAEQGKLVGYPQGIDLCLHGHCQNEEQDAGEERVDCGGTECVACAPGLPHYCSTETICSEVGLGGCDADEDCGVTGDETQLYCGLNQGVYYGYPEGVGACVPQGCLSGRNVPGRLGACSVDCPCGNAVGHCAHDAECLSGTCDLLAGARFGFDYGLGACVSPLCVNGSQDAGELGIDCGGACGACPVCPGNEAFNSLELPASSAWERVGALSASNNIQWEASTDATHLSQAHALRGQGTIRSSAFSSDAFATVGSELLFDVKFPIVAAAGSATLKLWLLEESGTRHELATVQSVATWMTQTAMLNAAERGLLNAQTEGLRFEIELLNDAPTYSGVVVLLDHFRLEGPGAALRSECATGQDPDEAADKQLVLGFEQASLWSSAEVTPQAEGADVRQGQAALRAAGVSHSLRSEVVTLGAEVGPVLQVDVRLPAASSGVLQGSLQAKLNCPEASGEVSLGTSSFGQLLAGQWNTLSYVVPSGLWTQLEGAPIACEVVLISSVSNAASLSQFVYDALRFVAQTHCSQFAQVSTPPFAVGMPVTPNGTANYPYPLCNAAQVQTVMATPALWDKHFVLQANIDLTGVSGSIGSAAQPFTGTFDGQWKALSNFAQVTQLSPGGLFTFILGDGVLDGQADGSIKRLVARDFDVSAGLTGGMVVGQCEECRLSDLVVDGGRLTGARNLGGLAGMNTGTIERVQSSAVVETTGGGDHIGGLVGFNIGRIVECRTSGEVIGDGARYVGGLVGIGLDGTEILESNATGDVSAAELVGGLVGLLGGNATVRHSSAHGDVVQDAAGEAAGGLVGQAYGVDLSEAWVHIEDCHATGRVEGQNGAGGLVGIMTAARVNDSFALGAISAGGARVGGLMGEADESIIERSYAHGAVSGHESVGGLVGAIRDTAITDVYAWGDVEAGDLAAGGLLGSAEAVDLRRGYSLGVVTSPAITGVGALVGQDTGTASEFLGNFYGAENNPALPGLGSSGVAGTGIDAQALLLETTFTDAGWNLHSIWEMGERGPELRRSLCTIYEQRNDPPFLVGVATPPDGSATNPYVLCNAQQIQWLMNNPNHALLPMRKNYVLGSDIDLTGVTGQLATTTTPFQGTFDGSGHRLSHYVRMQPTVSRGGLFNTLTADTTEDGSQDGIIKDLSILDFEVQGSTSTGTLVGQMRGKARGIRGMDLRAVSTASAVGGLFGDLTSGQVRNIELSRVHVECGSGRCGGLTSIEQASSVQALRLSEIEIVATNSAAFQIGGVVGFSQSGMSDVRVEGLNIQAPSNSYVGGAVGTNVSNSGMVVTDTHVSGQLVASGAVGGIAGYVVGSNLVQDCSAAVVVSGLNYVGGAVGLIRNGSRVERTSSTGAVTATVNSGGGLVGRAEYLTSLPAIAGLGIADSVSYADVFGAAATGGLAGGVAAGDVSNSSAHGKVTGTASNTGGLLGYLSAQGRISSSGATGDVVGTAYVGGLVGSVAASNITSSAARGQVKATAGYAGGLAGSIDNTVITNSEALGAVSNTGVGFVGGFVGAIVNGSKVDHCLATGDVSLQGGNSVGGFFGRLYTSSTVTDCRSAGRVDSTVNHAGGFGGDANNSRIKASSSSGDVVSTAGNVGGFVGWAQNRTLIEDSGATGNVSATGASSGAFVGALTQSYALGSHASGDATGPTSVGGFAGSADRSRISGSEASGNATGQSQTGAFAGVLAGSRLTDVFARGSATTSVSSATGGLVGVSYSGSSIRRAFSSGVAQGASTFSGGIAGNAQDLMIRDSYSVGDVVASGSSGGVIGGHFSSRVVDSFTYSRVLVPVTGGIATGGTANSSKPASQFESLFGHLTVNPASFAQTGTPGITGLTTQEFTDPSKFVGLDFENVWEMGELHPVLRQSLCESHELADQPPFILGLDLEPDGSAEAPYVLCAPEQVQAVMDSPELWSQHFRLGRDIILDGVVGQIGTYNVPFRGTFDGFGHALFNYQLSNTSLDVAGFFGHVQGDGTVDGSMDGVIKDMELISVRVTARDVVGALVGYLNSGRIEDVWVDNATVIAGGTRSGILAGSVEGWSTINGVSVNGTLTGKDRVGGVAGYVSAASSVERALSSGTASSSGVSVAAIGGLVGWTDGGPISRSSSAMVVAAAGDYAGGAVGNMVGGTALTRVRSTGTVTLSAGSKAGGLVGRVNNGTITDSYATGAVAGVQAGALIGAGTQVTVQRTFASGAVTGSGAKGAFIGDDAGSLTLSNSFATQSNVALPLSGNNTTFTGVTRLTTAQQTTTSVFQGAGWNFTNLWIMGSAAPELRTMIGYIL